MPYYLLQGIPIRQLDNNGNPLSGCKLYTTEAGSAWPTNPQTTYTSSTGGTPHPNPVVSDSEGFWPQVWVSSAAYKLEARKADGTSVLWTSDNVLSDSPAAASSYTPGGSGVTVTTVQTKLRLTVHAADHGAVGNGTTDDLTSIQNAATQALAQGTELILDGTKTYALGGQWAPAAGLLLRTNGATFKDLNGTAGASSLIVIDDNSIIDSLSVSVPTTITRTRAITFAGDNIRVSGNITVAYADQQAPSVNDDAAVRITGSNRVSIGGVIKVTNNDRGVQVHTSSSVTIGGLDITSYVRGLLIEDSSHVHIGCSKFGTLSANGSYTSGHNGVLFQSNATDLVRNVTLEDFVIEDAGEHGIRLGGPEQMSNIYLVRPRTKNCGGSGIKILTTDAAAPTSTSKRIYIVDPIIEDCGSGVLSNNMCGILVMFVVEVSITNPTVRKESKSQSGYYGIRICAVSDVVITSPDVSDATSDNIIVDATLGDITRLTINGGITRTAGRDGIRALTGTGTIRRLIVDGLATDSNTGYGALFTASGGTAVACRIRTLAYNDTSGPASCDSTAVTWNGSGTLGGLPGWTAENGSLWQREGTNTYCMVATVWTAVA